MCLKATVSRAIVSSSAVCIRMQSTQAATYISSSLNKLAINISCNLHKQAAIDKTLPYGYAAVDKAA